MIISLVMLCNYLEILCEATYVMLWFSDKYLYAYFAEFREDTATESEATRGKSRLTRVTKQSSKSVVL